jgi:predicted permease
VTVVEATAWIRDLRLALRQLARSPGFTAVAVLTLSIGIGANTAVFSVVNELLLRPPPHVVEPERVVTIWTSDFSGPPYGASSYPDYETFREQRDVMAGVAAFGLVPGNLVEADETTRLALEEVTGSYFDVLGVRAALGRVLIDADDGTAAIVLSHALWRDRFGADLAIVGRTIRINAEAFTVTGVAPEGFIGSLRAFGGVDAWVPLESISAAAGEGRRAERGSRRWLLLGRLQPGVSLEAARAHFAVVANQLLAAYPEEWRDVTARGRSITILPESESRVPPEIGRGALLGFVGFLSAGVALVLLICCVNVANLLLARGAARLREVAIRVSLGASRARLVRQLMTESAVLAALACAGAVLVTYAATRLLAQWRPPGDLAVNADVDWRVIAFALAAALATALIFGLAPALNVTRRGASAALKEGALAGKRRVGLRDALIVAQVSISLVLLVGAGLFLRSLQESAAIDPGFDANDVAVASFDLRTQGYTEARARAFYAELVERVAALPGVSAATLAQKIPLSGDSGRRRAGVEGYEPQPGEDMEFHNNVVGPSYFEVMRVPLVSGRAFTANDRDGAPQVAVVNETFAARYWPGENPIGKRLTFFGQVRDIEIVGVAGDGKYERLTEAPRPYLYRPFLQQYEDVILHVRVARDAEGFLPVLRDEIRALDRQLPILRLATMRAETAFSTFPQRIAATLLGACAVLALLLAAVGLYGIVAYAVSQRTREIGIRIALGAQRRAVVRMALAGSMKVVAVGLALGLVLALAAGRAVESFIGDVSAADPVALVAGPLVMLACAFVAAWLPARRAARVDPLKALREE